MKAEYLNCVMSGVLDVIDQCFHVECKKGKPYVYHYDINLNHLSAVIRMAGDKKGAFVLALSEDDAKKMASALIMEEKQFLDKDVMDAIGEIINNYTPLQQCLIYLNHRFTHIILLFYNIILMKPVL